MANNDHKIVLVSQLEELAASTSTSKNRQLRLPTVYQLYEIGKLMYRISGLANDDSSSSKNNDNGTNNDDDLRMSFQHFIESVPETYWKKSFDVIYKALITLLLNEKTASQDKINNVELLIETAESLCGLFSNSPLLCQIVSSKEWISTLATLYDRFVLRQLPDENKNCVLSSISFLLLDGIFLQISQQRSTLQNLETHFLDAIKAIEEESTDCLHDLQQWQSIYEPFKRNLQSTVKKLPPNALHDDELRDYILNMLESASSQQQEQQQQLAVAALDSSKSTTTTTINKQKQPTTATISPTDEVDRRIQQIKQILPDFGEGFLESALSLYRGDVETTVSVLLNDPSQYPQSLRFLDKNLPRRRGLGNKQKEMEEDMKARELVKERVAVEEEREQDRYKALLYMAEQEEEAKEQQLLLRREHDEYDDDYDDQYDDNDDVKLGGTDTGLYDMDQVKLYNETARQEESDKSFWEQNRNTNRKQNNNNNKNNEGGEKHYRGPDKIKGNRIIGPDGKVVRNNNNNRRGKGKGNQQQQTNGGGGGNNNQSQQQQQQKGGGGGGGGQNKPKTKPKKNNRINRQRDKKQKAQGAFGTQT